VTVAVLTSTVQLAGMPGNLSVPAGAAGLERDSVVDVTQIATIDPGALEDRVGSLPD
jgi:mRNA interferase MazF